MVATRAKAGAVTFAAIFGSLTMAGQSLGQAPVGVAPASGPRVELRYQSRFEVDSNPRLEADVQDPTFESIHSLDASLLSETRLQTFALRFGTDLRLPRQDDAEDTLTEPTFVLNYSRAVRSASLSLNANFRRRQIEFLEPFFLDGDDDTIIDEAGFSRSDGSLTELGFGAVLETGIERPLGVTYAFNYRSRTYSNNDDPGLFDSRTYNASTTARLRFSDISSGRLTARTRQYEYEGGRDAEGEEYGLSAGYSRSISPTLELDADVGVSRTAVDEVEDDRDLSRDDTGLTLDLSLVKTVPNGTWFGDIARELSDGRFRTDLTFGRTLDMRDYSLTGRVGLTRAEDGDAQTTFGLTYARELKDGSFSAAIRRGVTIDTLDEEELLTAVDVSYRKEINELSSLSLSLDVARIESTGAEDDADQTEAAVTASISRAITQDWDMTLGYRGRANVVEEDEAYSNSVFVTIGRNFTFRR